MSVVASSRKAYSCTPCRSKKIRCDRRTQCGNCARKGLSCVWPENGVTLEDEAGWPGTPGSRQRSGSDQASSSPVSVSGSGSGSGVPFPFPLSVVRGADASRSGNTSGPSGSGSSQRLRTEVFMSLPSMSSTSSSMSTLGAGLGQRTSSASAGSGAPARPQGEIQVNVPRDVAVAEQFDHSILNGSAPSPRSRGPSSSTPGGVAAAGPGAGASSSSAVAAYGSHDSSSSSAFSRPYWVGGGEMDFEGKPSTAAYVSKGKSRHKNGNGNGNEQRGSERESDDPEFESSRMVTAELLRHVPTQAHSDRLLRFYLDLVDWIHHPLHLPTLLSQYNKFWATPPDQRTETVPARWMALFYIVLCLGSHFGGESTKDERALYKACEDCLVYSDYMSNHSLEAIQTIICLNIYLNNNDGTAKARVHLAMAIKMAIGLGLSRVPPEDVAGEGDDVVDREIGRRVWWSLVCQDSYTSSASGFTYSINLAHATTQVFANADDEDIVPGRPLISRPLEEMTSATFQIAKIGFALVVRDFMDAINRTFPNPPYETILDLDRQFRVVFETSPRALRPDLAQPFALHTSASRSYIVQQRIFTGITLHNRIMRLHRAYMLRGYDDVTYSYSTRVCLESAYALLDLVRQSRRELCMWWVVLVHVWTSGLVISVDMFHAAPEADTVKQRDGIALAISLLETAVERSPVARRGVRVLQSLIDRHTNQTGQKRKRAEEDDDEDEDDVPEQAIANTALVTQPSVEPVPLLDASPLDLANPTWSMWQSLIETDFADIQNFDWSAYTQLADTFGWNRAEYS